MSASATHRAFWNRVVEKRLDAAVELLDPKGTFWSRPIGTVPMEAFIYIMMAVQRACPMTFDIRSDIEDGTRSVLEMQGHGLFSPSGEPYENAYVFIADVKNGLISHLREYNDSAYSNAVFGRNLPPEVQQTFGQMVAKAQSS